MDEGKARKEGEYLRSVVESFRRVAESLGDVSVQEDPPTGVTSEAAGYKYDPQAKEGGLCQLQRPSPNLSLLPTQQQALSCCICQRQYCNIAVFLGTRGHQGERMPPWKSHGADLDNLQQCYPVWITWKLMTKVRKSLVVKKLEF